jgi:hypothetical protein
MSKIEMIQTRDSAGIAILGWFLAFEFLSFKFVSDSDIRISNFVGRMCLNHALWA